MNSTINKSNFHNILHYSLDSYFFFAMDLYDIEYNLLRIIEND